MFMELKRGGILQKFANIVFIRTEKTSHCRILVRHFTLTIIDPGIFDKSSTAIQSVHYTKKSLDFPVLVHLV